MIQLMIIIQYILIATNTIMVIGLYKHFGLSFGYFEITMAMFVLAILIGYMLVYLIYAIIKGDNKGNKFGYDGE